MEEDNSKIIETNRKKNKLKLNTSSVTVGVLGFERGSLDTQHTSDKVAEIGEILQFYFTVSSR